MQVVCWNSYTTQFEGMYKIAYYYSGAQKSESSHFF